MLRVLGALEVSNFLGGFEFFPQFGETAFISDFGLLVEHLARVA
jgi:hypothetical protein